MENTIINEEDVRAVADEAVKILIEKKGMNIRMFDVREHSSVTDFYINVTGRSSTQVAALADEVVFQLEQRGVNALRVEGRKANSWLLVDYGYLIVNVFDQPSREFYNFDRHLPPSSEVDISPLIKAVDEKLNSIRNNFD